MLFRDFTFLWEPYRAARDENELQEAFITATERITEKKQLPPEYRIAVCRLLCSCVGDQGLMDVFYGLLLPPPYRLEEVYDRQMTRQELEEAMDIIPPELDPVITLLPFNLAVRTGVYDAHLRAAVRRLCWLFAIPFDLVEAREGALVDAVASSPSPSGDDGFLGLREKQQAVRSHKEEKNSSVRRVATVGTFAAVGGIALVFTGGLAAPFIAPALSALASATTSTLVFAGATGGALLGSTAAAVVMGGLVGAATHTAALVAVVTPVLTVAHMTVMFGIGGASLAGYRAYRRTADSDVFMIRSTTEIEELPPFVDGNDNALLSVLSESQKVQWRDASRRVAAEDKDHDLWMSVQTVLEETTRGGIVVPAHTRAVAMQNLATSDQFQRRMRCLTFAVQCSLRGYRLELKAVKLIAGTWGLVPPKIIGEDSAGIFVSLNRYARPTGAGCAVCYNIVPVAKAGMVAAAACMLRLWVLAELSLLGNLIISVAVTSVREAFKPRETLKKLREEIFDSDNTLTIQNILVETRFSPMPFVLISELTEEGDASKECSGAATFPAKEIQQRIVETMNTVSARRQIGVSIVNNSKHLVRVLRCVLLNGVRSSKSPHNTTNIDSKRASLDVFTNANMSLMGAEGFFLIEVVNGNIHDTIQVLHRVLYMKLQFEVSAWNNINVACVARLSLQGLMEYPLSLEQLPSSRPMPIPMLGSFVSADLRVNTNLHMVELRIEDFVERAVITEIHKSPSLTIAVGGFVSIFDQRRPQQDQQVALWAPFLPGARLFGATEAYVVHWEDEYQTKFGRTINAGSTTPIIDRLGDKVVSTATDAAKDYFLQGALFVGLRALDALKGTFSLPMYAVWATGVIDNVFATLSNRASYTGKDLAGALLDPHKGNRPVSLIGFGFGSRVIVECLRELNRVEAFGVVENVFLMGSTVTSSRALWRELRRVVAGRIVNIYSRSDWLLWLMYKMNEAALRPMAGISPVNVPGVENFDVTFLVKSHIDYASKLREIVSAIPERPTRKMYERSAGSPGAVVELGAMRSVSERISSSMGSFLGGEPCATLAIANRMVSDVKELSTELKYVTHVVHGGYFDFEPPESVPSSRCAVCGVIGCGDDAVENTLSGAVTYMLPLDSASADVLLIIFFHAVAEGDMLLAATADVRMVDRSRGSGDAGTDAERRKLLELAQKEAADPERIRLRCESAGQAWHGDPRTFSFTVNLDGVFRDGSKEAVFRVTTEFIGKCNFMVGVVALLTQSSTRLQRAKITAALFDENYHMGEPPSMVTPVKLELMTRTLNEFSSKFSMQIKNEQQQEEEEEMSFQPIVLVNCSETTFFCTGVSDKSDFFDAAAGLEWICLPSPELPSRSCVVTAVRRFSTTSTSSPSSLVPSQEKQQGDNAVLDAVVLDGDCGRCEVKILAGAGGGVDVACCFEPAPSADGNGSVSETRVEVGGVSFIIVTISWTPKTKGSEGDLEESSSCSNGGWILIE
ncbi:hypothetical protein DQ04_01941070 [Trypanosoma grayi]|uniref:hypothetical protein n=1 Tax=Trypanosoma grayi TaxID=71804 RepID=UPI0004F4A2B0|nr:hypothetical protein DQ04_01941070 [Trypanosoma grayi]KEG12160.1 hypothetical protein DQ04_01941070 [Trypanosoma grayi]